MNSYLIIIPAYNEEDAIAGVLNDVKDSKPNTDILVVNDGSNDNTSEIAKNAGAMVIDLPFNLGYGGAVQTGFRFAVDYGYDYVITIDGDAQHDPYSISSLIQTMELEKADMVVGSRFLEGNYSMGIFRKIGVWLFSKIARIYTGTDFTDPTSGFQLLSRKVFFYLAEGDNYPMDYPDVNIIMALHKMGFKLRESPVRMIEKTNGKSMHSGLKPLIYIARMFLAILMVVIRKED